MSSQWQRLAFGSETDPSLWELFHENTKLGRFSSGRSDKEIQTYMDGLIESLPFDGFPTVILPKRLAPLRMPVGKAIRSRVSVREMMPYVLLLDQLGTILYHGYGVTRHMGFGSRALRIIPSAGALYPLEIFVQARNVGFLAPGLYHYNPLKHHLRQIRDGDSTSEISRCLMENTIPKHASALMFITALFERSTFKYGDRGYRFVLLEAGHLAQNMNIACSAFGLGSLNIGGFFDREVDAFLRLDGITHSCVYMMAVGMTPQPGSAGGKNSKRRA